MKLVRGGQDRGVEAEFRRDLSALCGLPCLGAIAEARFATAVTLHFGKAFDLEEPLTDEHVPEFLRAHEGEVLLYVGCAWRLDTATEVVAGLVYEDDVAPATVAGLACLAGATLVDIRAVGPAYDLELEFTDGLVFRVFCDRAQADGNDNYSLLTATTSYLVGPAGKLTMAAIV